MSIIAGTSALGGIGVPLVKGFLGLFGASRARKRQRRQEIEDQLQYFPRMKQSAESAGLNLLTALGHSGFGSAGGRGFGGALASTEIALGTIDEIDDVLSGRKARQENREKVEDRIRELELERMASGFGRPMKTGSVTQTINVDPNEIPANQGIGTGSPVFRMPGFKQDVVQESVRGSSGLNMATMDSPDPEQDLWRAARDGTFREFVKEIGERNSDLIPGTIRTIMPWLMSGGGEANARIAERFNKMSDEEREALYKKAEETHQKQREWISGIFALPKKYGPPVVGKY